MNLFERVKGILLNPRAEWAIIEREPGDMAYLFMNYVAILAAIPAVCGFIGSSLIGISLPGLGTVRVPIVNVPWVPTVPACATNVSGLSTSSFVSVPLVNSGASVSIRPIS